MGIFVAGFFPGQRCRRCRRIWILRQKSARSAWCCGPGKRVGFEIFAGWKLEKALWRVRSRLYHLIFIIIRIIKIIWMFDIYEPPTSMFESPFGLNFGQFIFALRELVPRCGTRSRDRSADGDDRRGAGKFYRARSRLYEAKFCKQICVWKLSSRSTQCTPLHSSKITVFLMNCQNWEFAKN